MQPALLDTDILSEVIKAKDAHVVEQGRRYLATYPQFAFSAITLYEIVRGMLANRAFRQMQAFMRLAGDSDVVPISEPILLRAAELWADARDRGHPRDDADLIIAATALETSRLLVTGNTSHYDWIAGLPLSDWRTAGE
jgi:tRNA(fMet)-specific endonuclease VapC